MRTCLYLLLLLLTAAPASACFGPKLFLAAPAGEEGELLFHLVAIYVKEKTGVESLRVEQQADQTSEGLLQREEVDLVFNDRPSAHWPALLQIGDSLWLLSGPRPGNDLQFTTVPRALKKLQQLFGEADLQLLRQQVAGGVLPATAVRTLYMEKRWI